MIASHGLRYATELGWPVFPTGRGGKAPLVRSEVEGQGGRNMASLSEHVLRMWDKQFSVCNIAVATGAACGEHGLVVVDLDGEDGIRNWNSRFPTLLCDGASVSAKTGGSGRHLYFRHPGGRVVSRPLRLAYGRLSGSQGHPASIDIRGDGSSATLPPSVHASGRSYTWINSPFETLLAPFPPDLLHLVRERIPVPEIRSLRPIGDAAGRVEAICLRVASAAKGTRNHELNKWSYVAGQVARETGTAVDVVLDRLVEAAVRAGLPRDEARQTARSGLRAGGAR